MSLFRQGGQFAMIGALQLAVDCGIFIACTAAGMPAVPANLLGRISGATLGFWLNGRFTFAQQGDARLGWQRFARFAVMWLALTVISTWLLSATVDLVGLRQPGWPSHWWKAGLRSCRSSLAGTWCIADCCMRRRAIVLLFRDARQKRRHGWHANRPTGVTGSVHHLIGASPS